MTAPDAPPIGFVRRPGSGKLYCRTCGSAGWPEGRWMDTCRFGHAPCPRCGVITTLLPNGKPRTHGTCPEVTTCAGRAAVAHTPTSMVAGRCPVCGEVES